MFSFSFYKAHVRRKKPELRFVLSCIIYVLAGINSGQGWIQVLWGLKLNQYGGPLWGKACKITNTKLGMKVEFHVEWENKLNHIPFFSDLFRLFVGNAYIKMPHDYKLPFPPRVELSKSQQFLAPHGLVQGLSDPDCMENLLSSLRSRFSTMYVLCFVKSCVPKHPTQLFKKHEKTLLKGLQSFTPSA